MNEPVYVINGKERKIMKKRYNQLKFLVRSHMSRRQADDDMFASFGQVNPISEKCSNYIYAMAVEERDTLCIALAEKIKYIHVYNHILNEWIIITN